MKPGLAVIYALALLAACGSSCSLQTRSALEIKTSGFISENCYQAILKIAPNDNAQGLVAKRESAYLKSKTAALKEMALDNLSNYCMEKRLQKNDINRKEINLSVLRINLLSKLDDLVGDGSIAFAYYDETNSLIIGYRIFKNGFKQKIDALADEVELRQGSAAGRRR